MDRLELSEVLLFMVYHIDLGLLWFTFIIHRTLSCADATDADGGTQELNRVSEILIDTAASCKQPGPELRGHVDQAQVVLADGVGVAARELDFFFHLDGGRAL